MSWQDVNNVLVQWRDDTLLARIVIPLVIMVPLMALLAVARYKGWDK